jgi:hypothetical protein
MAKLTPEEYAKVMAKYGTVPAAPAPVPVVAPQALAPVDNTNRQARVKSEEEMKAAKAAQAAQTAADERRRVAIERERQLTGDAFSKEVAILNANEDLKTAAPPIYAAGYELGTTTPLGGMPFAPYVAPARPMNIAVPKAEAPGFLEAMRPQTMAPENVAMQSANRAAQVFDEQAFLESIADLPAEGKKSAIATHEAFKKAFFELRKQNPVETGVTDEELLKELRQQIKDFETGKGPTLTQGKANRGDIGGALERQVTPATIQIARPGALVYFSELSSNLQREGADAAANAAVANLMKAGVPVMAPVPGNREGLERQTGTRPATPTDVAKTKEAARKAYIEANPIPLSMLANRDELLANSEASATGGTLFQKEYITGATVESSLSSALRAAFTIPNYIAGEAIGTVLPAVTFGKLGMGPETRAREQAARPAGQKDMSPGVYNIATGGGFMKPIADMWTYSPVESVRDNAWIGSTFGLAADLLSLEAGAIGGLASGGRAMLGTTKALGVAGETSALRAAGTILAEGGKTAAATTAKSIGLPSLAKSIAPGDLRLIGATSVAENYKALSAYENDIANGGIPNTAIEAARKAAPNSNAVKAMSKQGASFNPAEFVKDSAAEYKEFKDIDDVVNAVASGATDADVLKLRPYLKAAASKPGVTKAIIDAANTGGLAASAPTMKASQVIDIIKQSPDALKAVSDAAAFDKGFKAVDRTVGLLEPGKNIVAITPRTFGTERSADNVIANAAKTPTEKVLSSIEKDAKGKAIKPVKIEFSLGGNTVNDVGYDLSVEKTKELISVLSKEANTGTMPKSAVNKAIQELRVNKISSSSIRELRYSNVDGVAERIRVLTQAPSGQGTFPISALNPGTSKSISYGTQTNSIKLVIDKIAKAIGDNIGTSTEKLNKLELNPQQVEIISAAKSKMSEVDKTLKAEFNALDNPEVAAKYGLPANANNSQKMAALTLGQEPDLYSRRNTLMNYVRSSLFGTDNLAFSRIVGEQIAPITPGFEYQVMDDIFNAEGRQAVQDIVNRYADIISTPDNVLEYLPRMMQEIDKLKDQKQLIEATDFAAGRAIVNDAAAQTASAESNAVAQINKIKSEAEAERALIQEEFTASDGRATARRRMNSDLLSVDGAVEREVFAANATRDAAIKAIEQNKLQQLKSVSADVGKETNKFKYLSTTFQEKKATGVFTLKNKPQEALIGAYARNKGDQIFSDALERTLAFDAMATSRTGQLANQAIGGGAYNEIMQAAIAHQIVNDTNSLGSIDELLAIPAVKKIAAKFAGNSEMTIGELLKTGGTGVRQLVDDINGTTQVVRSKLGIAPNIEFANELAKIGSGDIKISELGPGANPFSLRNAVRQELGSAAKYGELQNELGKLAEEAASGKKSAIYANRLVTDLFDAYNSFFYNAILSYNPRFHGRNFFYAPSIVHMTTGIGLDPEDMLAAARIMDPVSMRSMGKALMEEGRVAGTGIKADLVNDIVVTDRLGNNYTAGELYKIAVESGILKSQASANIDAKFLDEAAKLGLGDRPIKGMPKQILNFPSEMANAEDNLWRLATITHALKRGETLEGALRLGRRSLFDYGAATAFERQYVARKIMFYNYFRNSVLQGVRTLVENPGRVLKQYRLVNDLSRINVGDQNMDNLRLYAPMDAGVAAVATTYAPKAGKEGKMTVLPNMPYADAAIITAGLLYQPNNFLRGQENLVTGKRKFGSGFIFSKFGPGTQAAIRFYTGEQVMQDVAIKKNQLSLTHVAAAAALEDGSGGSVPALKALTGMYNAKVRDALPGEEGFEGKVYEMSPDDFAKYKTWIAGTMSMTGTERFVSDWAKLFSSAYEQGITGAKSRGLKENIGLTSTTSVDTPQARQTLAAEKSAEMLAAETKQKEIDAGLRRPDEPKKAGRIK